VDAAQLLSDEIGDLSRYVVRRVPGDDAVVVALAGDQRSMPSDGGEMLVAGDAAGLADGECQGLPCAMGSFAAAFIA
jgi:hypothetical protein